MHSIKIVLLDLGGVVFKSSGFSNEKINWNVITKLNYKYGYDLNIGENKFPEFIQEYNSLTNQNLNGDQFLKSVFDTLEINMQLINLIKSHCRIIIVSDNYRENIEYISKRYEFDSWSINQIYSYDYKMIKSDVSFFKRLLKDLKDFHVEEMMLIDDSPEKLRSAQLCNIKGILYQNNAQISKEFKTIFSL